MLGVFILCLDNCYLLFYSGREDSCFSKDMLGVFVTVSLAFSEKGAGLLLACRYFSF